MSNKYFFRAKISDEKLCIVLRLFSLDVEAKKSGGIYRINRNTVNNTKLRERISEICE